MRACLMAMAMGVCAGANATVLQVYEWSERGGTPVISTARPPAGVEQYTIQTVAVPAMSRDQRAQIEHRLAADRAVLSTPLPASNDRGVALALRNDSALTGICH
jgi:hypothetical protein